MIDDAVNHRLQLEGFRGNIQDVWWIGTGFDPPFCSLNAKLLNRKKNRKTVQFNVLMVFMVNVYAQIIH